MKCRPCSVTTWFSDKCIGIAFTVCDAHDCACDWSNLPVRVTSNFAKCKFSYLSVSLSVWQWITLSIVFSVESACNYVIICQNDEFLSCAVLCHGLSVFHNMSEHTDYLCGINAESFHCFYAINTFWPTSIACVLVEWCMCRNTLFGIRCTIVRSYDKLHELFRSLVVNTCSPLLVVTAAARIRTHTRSLRSQVRRVRAPPTTYFTYVPGRRECLWSLAHKDQRNTA